MSVVVPSHVTGLTDVASGFAQTILTAIQREYPYAPHHTIKSLDDAYSLPRQLHPAFYGCFDWHSSVHMHYSLIKLLRVCSTQVDALVIRRVIDRHFQSANLIAETNYLKSNPSWERPYGWGWVLTLTDELAEFASLGDLDARRWFRDIRPLADLVTDQFLNWLPKMANPVRCGTHLNSAFSLDRSLQWALRRAATGDTRLLDLIVSTGRRWFDADRNAPLSYEPQGTDFLSPALAEATLMAEILPPEEYSNWLARFLPMLSFSAGPLSDPVPVVDPSDGQLAHLDGLSLSRAWMLRRVARTLPDFDLRRRVCFDAADRNEQAGLKAVMNGEYMSEHWLATLAILAIEARG